MTPCENEPILWTIPAIFVNSNTNVAPLRQVADINRNTWPISSEYASGEERPKKAWYKKWWVWLIVVIVVAAVASRNKSGESGNVERGSTATSGSGQVATEPAKAESPKPIAITASEYYKEYEGNEVAADEKFKDKLIAITGTVEKVEKILGTVQVSLKAGDFVEEVTCSLSDDVNAAAITKGQRITFIGTGDGKTFFPKVDDCTISK